VQIIADSGKITLKAEFGGVKKLMKFLVFFIGGMMIFFLVLFGIMFHVQQKPMNVFLILGPLLPWPILIPVMAIVFKKRALRALDTLMRNIVKTQ